MALKKKKKEESGRSADKILDFQPQGAEKYLKIQITIIFSWLLKQLWLWPMAAGPNFMALLTQSKEYALTEARESVLTPSLFHRLAENVFVCACVLTLLGILRLHGNHSSLTQKSVACPINEECDRKVSKP